MFVFIALNAFLAAFGAVALLGAFWAVRFVCAIGLATSVDVTPTSHVRLEGIYVVIDRWTAAYRTAVRVRAEPIVAVIASLGEA